MKFIIPIGCVIFAFFCGLPSRAEAVDTAVVVVDTAMVVLPQKKEIPDFERIERVTFDPQSDCYFESLMVRYLQGDTLLGAEDYYYLYYGSSLQESYDPLARSAYSDSLELALSGITTTISESQLAYLECCLQQILMVNPFSIRDLNALAFIYSQQGKQTQASALVYKVGMLAYTIRNSGSGATRDSPWWVVNKGDITDIMNLMNINIGNVVPITIDIEFVSQVRPVGAKVKGYYFNYAPVNAYVVDNGAALAAKSNKKKLEVNAIRDPRTGKNLLPRDKKKKKK